MVGSSIGQFMQYKLLLGGLIQWTEHVGEIAIKEVYLTLINLFALNHFFFYSREYSM